MTGTAILQTAYAGALRLAVEIAWGADLTDLTEASWTWTDVTGDVLQADGRMVNWSVGQADETSVAQPANCTFSLDNRANLYSANNPLCTNYPYVRRGTPVRVRMSKDSGATWYVRFQGRADGFAPTWDSTGTYAVVDVSASGVFRRLNQGNNPVKSPLARRIVADADTYGLRQYWSCEDAYRSTTVASGLPDGPPMIVQGAVAFAQFDPSQVFSSFLRGRYGTGALPQLNGGGTLRATFPAGSASSWTVQFGACAPVGDGFTLDNVTLAEWSTPGGTYSRWQAVIDDGSLTFGMRVVAIKPDGTSATVVNETSTISGRWDNWRITAAQSGGNISVTLLVGSAALGAGGSGTLTTATLAGVAGFTGNPLAKSATYDITVSHIQIWDGTTAPNYQPAAEGDSAWYAYQGETASARLTRLCGEEGIPFATVDLYQGVALMGPQGVDTLANLARECELADAGFLYDGMSDGVLYQGISQRQDQAVALTLDAATAQFIAPFEALDDDYRTRNSVVVSRNNGSGAVAEDTTGPLGINTIGKYDTQITVNQVDDTELANRAGWELHSGTLQGFRYPTVNLDFAARPTVGQAWLARADGGTGPVPPGSHLQLTNVSSWISQHPSGPVDLCVIGWSESVSQVQWTAVLNCMPNDVYNVFKIGDTQLGRLVSAGHTTLHANVTAGATSFQVDVADDALWTTTATFPADFPLYVEISGIKVTVSGISGTGTPQTFTVSGVTKNLSSGAGVQVWKPGVLSL